MEHQVVLRPHHLVCLQRFVGVGYSEEFVERAHEIAEIILYSDSYIILVKGADDLCKNCPKIDECGIGVDSMLASELDNAILESTRLPVGESMPAKEVLEKISKAFPTVKDLCKGCQWLDICISVEKKGV